MQLRLWGRYPSRQPRSCAPKPPRLRCVRRHAALTAGWALACTPLLASATGGSLQAPSTAPESFVHESWTVEDGLPVNSINALLQSKDGYLWIATFDGLVRFDGVRFSVFNSTNTPGLPSNRITHLLEARDGTLWLVTEQGQLVRFRDGAFTSIAPERVLEHPEGPLQEDASGTLWVGTRSGLGVIRDDGFVPVAPGTIRGNVRAILQRADGSIWVGMAEGGLYRVEGERAEPVVAATGLAAYEVSALYEDPEGTLWIGTTAGIWRYHEALERVHHTGNGHRIRTSPRTGELWVLAVRQVLRHSGAGMARVLDRTDAVFRSGLLLTDADGRMLYTSGPELHREGRRIFRLPSPEGGAGAGLHTITALVLDHEGSLWLGTFGAGLHRLKPALFRVYGEAEGLSHRNVYSVYEDRAGAIWIGTLGGGTNRLAGGRASKLELDAGYPPTVRSFLQDRSGRLWLGADWPGDAVRVCPSPGARCQPPAPDPIGREAVFAIHEERGGALWFGTRGGLFRYDAGHWTRFAAADGAPASVVRVFLPTRDGALWMGTNGGGLARYYAGRFTRVGTAEGLPFDLVRSLYQDADGWLWVGTEGRGLARLDPGEWVEEGAGGRIVTYNMDDGLFDEVIHQILEDDSGRLWMSSNRGIFWVRRAELLDFAAGRIRRINSVSYTERDGLRNREANGGNQLAGIRTRDGRLWFATQDGVAVVDPAGVQQNQIPPNVVIEQVRAGGTPMHAGGGALQLGVEQRDLEIDYTALSFLAPANVRFRYRLEPYDRDWVDAGGRRTAYYTRVPPGRYTFRVLASNNDGVWNEEGAALALRLAPHLWETGTFRALASLAVVLLLGAGVGWRVRNMRARTRELARLVAERTAELRAREAQLETRNSQLANQTEQLATQNALLEVQAEQLQELDRAKSHFFANVSHEFRTPLTLTIGPLEDLRTRLAERDGGEPPRQLDLALRNARRLLRLVNQILDVARLEAGQMKLRAREQELVAFARGVAAAFTPVAEQKRIDFQVLAPPGEIPVWFDPDALEKVLANLLSNAFKFTPEAGRIELCLESDAWAGGEGVVRLQVRDTGPGIPAAHLPHVFERFYQVDETNTRAQPGTGIGLALASELVELHGGWITVESGGAGEQAKKGTEVQGRGSRFSSARPPRRSPAGGVEEGGPGAVFTVTLPLGRAHLRDDQLAPLPAGAPLWDEGTPATEAASAPEHDGVEAVPAGAVEDVTTLLVVDDSADLRAYVRAHFEQRYRVLEAADGAEGIRVTRERLPDLVISDVMMPGTDGHTLCRALKSSPETDFIPVLLLTARASTEDRVAGLVGGADDYLGKPFEMRELAARVENLIASRRRLRERFAGAPVTPRRATAGLAPAERAFVKRLQAAVEVHFADPDFGVAELARAVFLDRSHLSRRTRELLSETPSDLIRRLRLEHAAPLLAEGTGSVSEVAYGVGFQSVSHFSQCFREHYGVSPSRYRETLLPR